MEITAQMVKELRESTGAGMMDCKKALVETDGDMDKAIDTLREKGLSKAAKKADRIAAEGLVGVQSTSCSKNVAVVEINSETDFVAKNEEFKQMVSDITKIVLDNNLSSMEELLKCELNGTTVEEELNTKIAKIKILTFFSFFSIYAFSSSDFIYSILSISFSKKFFCNS